MKNFLFLFLLFLPFNFIYSQDSRETRIYVPPITGIGSFDEKTYFYKQLSYEVVTQFHSIVRLKLSSDYTLQGRIEPFACLHDPFIACPLHPRETWSDTNEVSEFIFYLELIKSKTDEIVGGQYIIYTDIDDTIDGMIAVIVYNMLSGIPDIDLGDPAHNRWIFLGASVMWAPRIYENKNESVYWLNVAGGVEAEVHFLNWMSISAGLQFTQDWILISAETNEEYRDLIMEIPLALKFVIKPADYLLLQIYGGVSYNFSLMNITEPCPFSWFAGIQLGVKAGPGFITIDPRFTMDYFPSSLGSAAATQLEYHRYMIQIGLGYKFGFISKKTGQR